LWQRTWITFNVTGTPRLNWQGIICKGQTTIDSLPESNALASLTHIPLNHDLATTLSLILSPRIEVHPSSKNGEQPNDVAMKLTIDGGLSVSEHLLLSTLRPSNLETLHQMSLLKEIEDLL